MKIEIKKRERKTDGEKNGIQRKGNKGERHKSINLIYDDAHCLSNKRKEKKRKKRDKQEYCPEPDVIKKRRGKVNDSLWEEGVFIRGTHRKMFLVCLFKSKSTRAK